MANKDAPVRDPSEEEKGAGAGELISYYLVASKLQSSSAPSPLWKGGSHTNALDQSNGSSRVVRSWNGTIVVPKKRKKKTKKMAWRDPVTVSEVESHVLGGGWGCVECTNHWYDYGKLVSLGWMMTLVLSISAMVSWVTYWKLGHLLEVEELGVQVIKIAVFIIINILSNTQMACSRTVIKPSSWSNNILLWLLQSISLGSYRRSSWWNPPRLMHAAFPRGCVLLIKRTKGKKWRL